jgi:hypothetical protein
MAIVSVEAVLAAAGRPMTMAELQEALPERSRLATALAAAKRMGYARSILNGEAPVTYAYVPGGKVECVPCGGLYVQRRQNQPPAKCPWCGSLDVKPWKGLVPEPGE